MDPNETLAAIRREIAKGNTETGADAGRICELVDALDGWLSRGGFPPTVWQPPTPHPLLTGNDHLVTKARHPVESIRLDWAVHVAVHLNAATPIVARLYKQEGRATIHLGAPGVETTLFTDAGQVDRLANLFATVRHRLTD